MNDAEQIFDAAYWRAVERFGKTCGNCGYTIKPHPKSSTGWWHVGEWEGIRCFGMLLGATPAK